MIEPLTSSQHNQGLTISPFGKKSEGRWHLQEWLPLGQLNVLIPVSDDPRSYPQSSFNSLEHLSFPKLPLNQVHRLDHLGLSVYKLLRRNLICHQPALEPVVDVE